MNETPLSIPEAIVRLETLCARGEHCTYELRQKLLQWGIPPFKHQDVIEHLMRKHFVDDRRFANACVRTKFNINGWGRAKIEIWLRSRHVEYDIIREALKTQIDPVDYKAKLQSMLSTKFNNLGGEMTFDVRQKLYRFALHKGFEVDVVMEVISKLAED